jgi:two-component system chemotaxis response regulator CheB
MQIVKSGADYRIRLTDGERGSGHKPSVDVMFASLAECCGKNTVAAILTGMGKDGAEGMHLLYQKGAYTIAQNEQTCVVYGMPKEALKTGGVDSVHAIEDIADDMIQHLLKTKAGSRL